MGGGAPGASLPGPGFPGAGMGGGAGRAGGAPPGMMPPMGANAGRAGGVPGGMMPGGEFGAFEQPKHEVVVAIELKTVPKQISPQPFQVYEADHRWGRKGRFPMAPIVDYHVVKQESPAREFTKKFAKDVQDGKDADRMAFAALWALRHGLKPQFHNTMADLVKLDPKHTIAAAYMAVQADLKKPLAADDPVTKSLIADLLADGYRVVPSEAGHYAVLTKVPASTQVEAQLKRRLNRFEETFENYFYWFAMQGNVPVPPMPKHRLLVLLAHDANDFHRHHAWWGSETHVADGFTPRRDNLIVLSARRLDGDYTTLEKNTQQLWAQARVNRDDLVSGAVWDLKVAKDNFFMMSAVQTLALMQKAMEEEAERAAISHEGVKQLLYATGVLPRFVNVPEWVEFGMASFFDTPQGALYPGVALPSWSQLVAFKHFRKYNRLGGSAQAALTGTITNAFFRQAREADGGDQDKGEKPSEQLEIARATAWSFVYYLGQNKRMSAMLRLGQELNQLPRDLDLDDATLQGCFARAFEMVDPKDPRKVDPARLKNLADAWFADLLAVNLEVPEVETMYLGRRAAASMPPRPRTQQNPNTPPGLLPPGAQPGLMPPGAQPKGPNINPNLRAPG